MRRFNYSLEKSKKLQKERGISFDEIIALIEADKLIDVLEHPNQKDYPDQKIYVLDVEGYIWLVPFLESSEEIFLKTAFPSRKHARKYLEGEK